MTDPGESVTAHEHSWHLPEGSYVVIDTYPAQYPYVCECGAFTHAPESGSPCQICAPVDYARRTLDLVHLVGGPFDGQMIARPLNRSVLLRCDDDDKRVQKVVSYEQSNDYPTVWAFRWNDWTKPFEPRTTASSDGNSP